MNPNVIRLLLLLGLMAWHGYGAEQRLCAKARDDRIVFPHEDDAVQLANETSSGNVSSIITVPTNLTMPDALQPNASSTSSNATEEPSIGNRILVDTLPVCQAGFQLRAGRCRKSA